MFLRIVTVPKSALISAGARALHGGAYALNNIMDNVWVLLIFGLFGYALVKFGFPLAPLILGVILARPDRGEPGARHHDDANPWLFSPAPSRALSIALSVASVVLAVWQAPPHPVPPRQGPRSRRRLLATREEGPMLKVGIVGMGVIGQAIAKAASGHLRA